jgi:hypothetical protein
MDAPVEPEPPTARTLVGCALVVLGAIVLVAGLIALDGEAKGSLALVVGPAALLVAAGAALVR